MNTSQTDDLILMMLVQGKYQPQSLILLLLLLYFTLVLFHFTMEINVFLYMTTEKMDFP